MATHSKSNCKDLIFVLTGMAYRPSAVLRKLKAQSESGWGFFVKYGIFFTLIASMARAVYGFESESFKVFPFLWQSLLHVFAFWITLIGGAALVARLTGKFGSPATFSLVLLSITFAYLPLLASFLLQAVLPAISLIWVAGLFYTVILFWKSADTILKIPVERRTGFTLLAFFLFLGLGYLSALFFDLITFATVGKI